MLDRCAPLAGLSLPEREDMRAHLGEKDQEAFIELMEQWTAHWAPRIKRKPPGHIERLGYKGTSCEFRDQTLEGWRSE